MDFLRRPWDIAGLSAYLKRGRIGKGGGANCLVAHLALPLSAQVH